MIKHRQKKTFNPVTVRLMLTAKPVTCYLSPTIVL